MSTRSGPVAGNRRRYPELLVRGLRTCDVQQVIPVVCVQQVPVGPVEHRMRTPSGDQLRRVELRHPCPHGRDHRALQEIHAMHGLHVPWPAARVADRDLEPDPVVWAQVRPGARIGIARISEPPVGFQPSQRPVEFTG